MSLQASRFRLSPAQHRVSKRPILRAIGRQGERLKPGRDEVWAVGLFEGAGEAHQLLQALTGGRSLYDSRSVEVDQDEAHRSFVFLTRLDEYVSQMEVAV